MTGNWKSCLTVCGGKMLLGKGGHQGCRGGGPGASTVIHRFLKQTPALLDCTTPLGPSPLVLSPCLLALLIWPGDVVCIPSPRLSLESRPCPCLCEVPTHALCEHSKGIQRPLAEPSAQGSR